MIDINKYIKGIQTFNDWRQYDIKALNHNELLTFIHYLKNNYIEVYPRIQRMDDRYIGDIQVHGYKYIYE